MRQKDKPIMDVSASQGYDRWNSCYFFNVYGDTKMYILSLTLLNVIAGR